VLLAYANTPEQGAALPIAVIAVQEAAPASNLSLYVLDEWQKRVRESHQAYLRDLFGEWVATRNDNALEVMTNLSALSTGPLRTVDAGECNENEVVRKVSDFLGFGYMKLEGFSRS